MSDPRGESPFQGWKKLVLPRSGVPGSFTEVTPYLHQMQKGQGSPLCSPPTPSPIVEGEGVAVRDTELEVGLAKIRFPTQTAPDVGVFWGRILVQVHRCRIQLFCRVQDLLPLL